MRTSWHSRASNRASGDDAMAISANDGTIRSGTRFADEAAHASFHPLSREPL
jgi:hypothetical protein